jgi:hypothetical protein
VTLVLTQVYLEPTQKKALAAEAKRRGRKPSDLMREAVDAMVLGVNVHELQQLDAATKRAKADLDAIVATLDANARQHRDFMAEFARLRRDAADQAADEAERPAAAKRGPARRRKTP